MKNKKTYIIIISFTIFIYIIIYINKYKINNELSYYITINYNKSINLVEEGADPNTPVNPKPFATVQDFINRLFSKSPPTSNRATTAFMVACGYRLDPEAISKEKGDPNLVRAMIRHGANINATDPEGGTPLMSAASSHFTSILTVLLDHGAEIDRQDDRGDTALHYAVSYPDVVRILLKHHANPNIRDQHGNTPLTWASGQPDVENLLKQSGAKN